MILHLLFDSQFSDYVIEQFASKEMQSDFVLVSPTLEMKHFKCIDVVRVVNPCVENELKQLLADISNYRSVIFHGLFYSWQEWLLNRWPAYVKVAWACWGGELYGQPDIRASFLKPLSKCADWLHRILCSNENHEEIFSKKLLKKADYCLTGVESEYEYAKQYLGTDIQYLPYSYYSIDETLGTLKDKHSIGKNIFVGNSATIENNHIETFLKLKRVGIGNNKLIVPLSYGSPWVRNMCLRVGKVLFGERFTPLLDFIPREEYNATMLNCSVMIQPHLREQAHGNIVTGLWLGMRVYMSKQGIDYKRFRKIGVHLYSIENDLCCNNPKVLAPLTENEIVHNRKLLLQYYSHDVILHNVQNIVGVLS